MKIEQYLPRPIRFGSPKSEIEPPHADDMGFMNRCLTLAKEAGQAGDIPVGAVVVKDGKIIGEGKNTREVDGCAVNHAEILAIEQACRTLGDWHLTDCTLYVTLEPCPMCAGAVINARIARVVFGASDNRAGAFGSVLNLNRYPLNHTVRKTVGVQESECRSLLTSFFAARRSETTK